MPDPDNKNPLYGKTTDELEADADAILAAYAAGEEVDTTIAPEVDKDAPKPGTPEREEWDKAQVAKGDESPKDDGSQVVKDDDKTMGKAEVKDDDAATKEVRPKVDKEEEAKEFDTEGLNETDAKRVKDAQAWGHKRAGEAARMKAVNEALNERLRSAEAKGKVTAPDVKAVTKAVQGMTTEQVASLKEAYPGLEDLIGLVSDQQQQIVNLQGHATQTSKIQTASIEKTSENEWMAEIQKSHPDADKIQNTDQFNGWLATQPFYVQNAISEGAFPSDVVAILTSYKDAVGLGKEDVPAEEEPESKVDQARKVAAHQVAKPARHREPGKGTGEVITTEEIRAFQADMQHKTPEEIATFDAKVDLAITEGRVTE